MAAGSSSGRPKRPKRYSNGQLTYGPWYISDWIASASVLGLSDAGYRLYHLLCLRVMERGPIPDDPVTVSAYCPGVRDFDRAWAEIQPLLIRDARGVFQRRALAEHLHGVGVCAQATSSIHGRHGTNVPTNVPTDEGTNGGTTQTQTQTQDPNRRPETQTQTPKGKQKGTPPEPLRAEVAEIMVAWEGYVGALSPKTYATNAKHAGQLLDRGCLADPAAKGVDPPGPQTLARVLGAIAWLQAETPSSSGFTWNTSVRSIEKLRQKWPKIERSAKGGATYMDRVNQTLENL